MMPNFRIALLWSMVCFGIGALSGCENVTSEAASGVAVDAAIAAEENVNPTVNAGYKDPALDVAQWAERFTGESREVFTARFEVLAALALAPGDRIADIGAGTGLYVKLFAEAVGASGQVYAVDIAQPFLDFIEENAAADGLTNVMTVLGEDRTTNLPEGVLDIAFHSDVYHHFEFPRTMNLDLARALRPGGRLFVLDFERIEGVTSEWVLGHVRAGKDVVRAEIESSGFDFVREHDLPALQDNYLLEFRRSPAAT